MNEPFEGGVERQIRTQSRVTRLTSTLVTRLTQSFLEGTPTLHNLVEHAIGGQWTCDLNWPAYGLDRYFLHAYLSTRQPKYIYSHLMTPATRRVLASTALSGFQTVLIEYLWPKNAPDDKFLRYLYSRTDQNVLAYSVHRVLADTRFFNLDQLHLPEGEDVWDSVDLQILALSQPRNATTPHVRTFTYGGDTIHLPGSTGWKLAAEFLAKPSSYSYLPPDSHSTFEFDSHAVGFTEKIALIFRGTFDALPLCQSLPFGHYFQTEEVSYAGSVKLEGQLGHVVLFDFPAMRVAQVNTFLDNLLRDPAVAAHSVNSYLADQSLRKVQNLNLTRVNPLRCNPWDAKTGTYYHLPKRVLRDGAWHTLALKDQMAQLHHAWTDESP
ncbi:MAG: hypothetical protein RBG13Loki_2677 [Promethearchaeota archaeon CR_4]|nr:MAG: hypothetical protein RBG13Loki_2677 [Candidatus Lokiarchaeota archaeon CR_4]